MENKSKGQISGILIILAIAILIVIVAVFLILKLSANRRQVSLIPEESVIPEKVYDIVLGDTRFLFELAKDLGDTLTPSMSRVAYQEGVITSERFIKVIIGAQNKGKENLKRYSWEVGNIIDSDGRNFVPSTNVFYFLPHPDLCGSLLKPEFEPIPCVKIYEVSKASTELKIEVIVTDKNGKKQTGLLDLDVTQ